MKRVGPALFEEMKRVSSNIAAAWKVTREDGTVLGFTSSDRSFVYNEVEYRTTSTFSASAASSKNNFSVDNMSTIGIMGDDIEERHLRSGVYDNAKVELFWIRPDKPEWGILPIRGGRMGEIKITNGQFETELRSVLQQLQQPFGDVYTIECLAQLGDDRCTVEMNPLAWVAATTYAGKIEGEAGIGSIVRPSVENGFWYQCVMAAKQVQTDAPETSSAYQQFLKAIREAENRRQAEFWGRFFPAALGGDSTKGRVLVATPPALTVQYGVSGDTEPVWPLAAGATVVDGGVTWEAIRSRRVSGTVTGVYNRATFEDRDFFDYYPDDYFQYGVLTWTSGENEGARMEVREFKRRPRAGFKLLEAMANEVKPGDTFTVEQGCPKTRFACRNLFANLNNMRAFPDMPTEDKALATPNFTSQGEQQKKESGGGS